jgi:hypothetical protein
VSSEVQADKWSPGTGVAGTLGDSGDTFTVPSGATLAIASGATLANSGTQTGFGLFSSYAIIADQKTQNTAGGTFTSGAWRTHDLQTEIADPDGIVSISSDEFTLAAGTYLIKWGAPAYTTYNHQTRLYNVTDAASVGVGQSSYSNATTGPYSTSYGSARTTIAGSKVFRIEHRCNTTAATVGFGVASNFTTEQYCTVEIFKEA